MPVSGVRGKSPKKLKFKKFSIRFVLCIAYIVGLCWMVFLDILWIYRTEVLFGKIINVMFDFSSLVSIFCFLDLATKWPELMIKWNEVEKFLPKLKYQMDKQKMAYEIKMAAFIILFISMGKLLIKQSRTALNFYVLSFQRNIFCRLQLAHMVLTIAQRLKIRSELFTFQVILKYF